jgi:hypothetical protein
LPRRARNDDAHLLHYALNQKGFPTRSFYVLYF